jgi:signal transduction histidine kinase
MTSAVAFGIGGLALLAVYLIVLSGVRSLTMRRRFLTGTVVEVNGQPRFVVEGLEEVDLPTVEGIVKEVILNQIAVTALIVLVVLFVISVLVGWIVAGRALRPLKSMTQVAEEIQATDLTRRIEIDGPDDEMKTMAHTFNGMLDRLDTAFRSQRRFLAETSHDLRTPLATIRSNVEVTLSDQGADVSAWRETGEIVSRSAERMSGMLDELLSAARHEVEREQMTALDLSALAQRVAQDFAVEASDAAVDLVVEGEAPVVRGDRALLERALGNLVANALAVAPPDTRILISLDEGDGSASMAVTDEGPGIDPDLVSGSRTTSGLGLSIVRDVMARHGGSVEAVVGNQTGASLVLILPIDEK